MARGKYEAKKNGTDDPPAGVSRGVGSPIAAGSTALPATSGPGLAGQAAETPALGIIVMSSWGWRIMAVAVMVGLGLCVTFLLDGHSALGGLWAFVALAWGFFTVKLWRMHLAWDAGR